MFLLVKSPFVSIYFDNEPDEAHSIMMAQISSIRTMSNVRITFMWLTFFEIRSSLESIIELNDFGNVLNAITLSEKKHLFIILT